LKNAWWNDKLTRNKFAASLIVASIVAQMNPRDVALRNLLTTSGNSLPFMQKVKHNELQGVINLCNISQYAN
jgi:hypothetical protein